MLRWWWATWAGHATTARALGGGRHCWGRWTGLPPDEHGCTREPSGVACGRPWAPLQPRRPSLSLSPSGPLQLPSVSGTPRAEPLLTPPYMEGKGKREEPWEKELPLVATQGKARLPFEDEADWLGSEAGPSKGPDLRGRDRLAREENRLAADQSSPNWLPQREKE